jgi:class 3 adenylate cyclase
MSETRKLAAILVTDIVGFSRLASIDEERTLARLRALRGDLIDPAVAAHHGRIVKGTGDGSIVEFRSVVDAVRCAIEMQNGLVERNAGVPPERRIEFRVGIHVGDVVEESDGDLMGDGVNIAARLEGIAKPGAICLSEDAYRQVKGRLEMKVSDLGPTQLKNIAEPVRTYLVEVGWPDEPLKRRSAPRHRLVAALATLAILVVAGAAGWNSIAGKPSTTASSSTTPTDSSFGPTGDLMPATGTQPTASSFDPTVDIMPATGNQPTPSHPQTQRQMKPPLTGQPDPHPAVRKVGRSSAKGSPSSSESAQSSSVESASNSSEPCFNSAAQTNGNHPSCAYLRGQPPNAEVEQSRPIESASDSSRPCSISAAQTNANHVPCAYLRGH